MNLNIRVLLSLTCCLLVASPTLAAEATRQARRPKSSRAANKVRRKAEPTPAEIARRREEINWLMLNGEYQHDGAGELLYIGDMSSVPALLRVLKDHPPMGMSDGRQVYICTYAHAVAALKKITGHNATSYEDWAAWWEEYQKVNAK